MEAFSRLLTLLGAALIIFDIIRVWDYFDVQKDVLVSHKGVRRFLTILVYVLLFLFIVGYCLVIALRMDSLTVGLTMLFLSIFLTIFIQWSISILDGIKEKTMEICESLVGLLETGDPNLNGHSLHVRNLSMLLYEYLPFNYKKKIPAENLGYASLLHDLGKLGVPGKILNKPGKLEGDEWELMKRHPEIGVNILKPIKVFEPILDWILYHHERVDGGGYYKLKGEEIPLAARLIAVCDTFSAIVMVRSYKPSRTYEDAITVLKMAAGTQLDQELVDIFCNIPKEKVDACGVNVEKVMDALIDERFHSADDLHIARD